MEAKVNDLYTSLQQIDSRATEEKRKDFVKWFLKNNMQLFIRSFFKNDLRIGATAKQLYLGESTVSFRLNRIEHFTGLNIRHFWDAAQLMLCLASCELQ